MTDRMTVPPNSRLRRHAIIPGFLFWAGLIEAPGWDTVDEYKANMLEWATYTFPEVKLWHHRVAGDAQGKWKNWVKNGLANYVAGYHPLFMGCKCGKRLFAKPYGVGAVG